MRYIVLLLTLASTSCSAFCSLVCPDSAGKTEAQMRAVGLVRSGYLEEHRYFLALLDKLKQNNPATADAIDKMRAQIEGNAQTIQGVIDEVVASIKASDLSREAQDKLIALVSEKVAAH